MLLTTILFGAQSPKNPSQEFFGDQVGYRMTLVMTNHLDEEGNPVASEVVEEYFFKNDGKWVLFCATPSHPRFGIKPLPIPYAEREDEERREIKKRGRKLSNNEKAAEPSVFERTAKGNLLSTSKNASPTLPTWRYYRGTRHAGTQRAEFVLLAVTKQGAIQHIVSIPAKGNLVVESWEIKNTSSKPLFWHDLYRFGTTPGAYKQKSPFLASSGFPVKSLKSGRFFGFEGSNPIPPKATVVFYKATHLGATTKGKEPVKAPTVPTAMPPLG